MSWSLAHCITMQRINVAVNTEEEKWELWMRGRRICPHMANFFLAFPMILGHSIMCCNSNAEMLQKEVYSLCV